MKTLLYVNDVLFSHSSGEIVHTKGLLQGLADHYRVVYFSHKANRELLGLLPPTITLRFLPSLTRIRTLSKIWYHLYVVFHAIQDPRRYDVLFVRDSNFTFVSQVWLLALLQSRVRLIEINGVRAVESRGIAARLLRPLSYWVYRTYHSFDWVIAVSEGIRKYLQHRVGLNNVVVVANGSSLGCSFPVPRLAREKKAVFVGGLSQWQNFPLLIRAVKVHSDLLRSEHARIELLGGGGRLGEILDAVRRLEISDLVSVVGPRPHATVAQVLCSARVGLLLDTRTYMGEFLFSPLKYFDYLACGLMPLLLTDRLIEPRMGGPLTVVSEDKFADLLIELMRSQEVPTHSRSWRHVAQEVLYLINA